MLKKNRAQISMFVIISIILIIVSSFLFYNSGSDFFVSHETKIKTQVLDSVKSCVLKEAKSGTFLLGFQGGRINLPTDLSLDPKNFKNKYIDLGFKISNWDSQLGDVPTLNSMKLELENYITNNSLGCIDNNLKALKDSLNISVVGDLKVDVTFNKNDVVVDTTYPIRYNERNSAQTFFIENYFVKLEGVKLKGLFELASQIYNLESSNNIFEKLVLEQIYSANDYSSKNSMPSEGMNIKCGFTPWTIPQLKSNLANLNNKNFKFLQFSGTYSKENILNLNFNKDLNTLGLLDYYKSPVVGYVQNLQNPKSYFKNFDVKVSMPSVEVTGNSGYLQSYPYRKFEVSPSSGNLVKPMNMKIDSGVKIPIPCIQVFHHLYSLDYDLLIKLEDKSVDGNNYFFQFPLRVLIEKNNPKKKLNPIINLERPTATNEKFCADTNKKYPLTVYATDKKTGNSLDDVQISYDCVSLSCDIGKTKRLSYKGVVYGNNPYFEGKFPSCFGGKIVAKKEGYFRGITKGVNVDSSLLGDNSGSVKEVQLIPKIDFSLDKSSFLFVDKDTKQSFRIHSKSDGMVYVSISNKGLGFSTNALFPFEKDSLDFNKITLLDDDISYNVSVIYLDAQDKLKGMLELQNWKPNVNSGSKLEFVIPVTSTEINGDTYMAFLDYMNFVVSGGDYGIHLI